MRALFWFAVIIAVTVSVIVSKPQASIDVRQFEGPELSGGVAQLFEGRTVAQTFVPRDDEIVGVAFLLGTFKRTNTGILTVAVASAEEETSTLVIGSELVRVSMAEQELVDNGLAVFWFTPTRVKPGKKYVAYLSSTSPQGQGPGVWLSPDDRYADGSWYSAEQGSKLQQLAGDVAFAVYAPGAPWFSSHPSAGPPPMLPIRAVGVLLIASAALAALAAAKLDSLTRTEPP